MIEIYLLIVVNRLVQEDSLKDRRCDVSGKSLPGDVLNDENGEKNGNVL